MSPSQKLSFATAQQEENALMEAIHQLQRQTLLNEQRTDRKYAFVVDSTGATAALATAVGQLHVLCRALQAGSLQPQEPCFALQGNNSAWCCLHVLYTSRVHSRR